VSRQSRDSRTRRVHWPGSSPTIRNHTRCNVYRYRDERAVQCGPIVLGGSYGAARQNRSKMVLEAASE
jgi:hypothetical protein